MAIRRCKNDRNEKRGQWVTPPVEPPADANVDTPEGQEDAVPNATKAIWWRANTAPNSNSAALAIRRHATSG
jgi:hypothetical protein